MMGESAEMQDYVWLILLGIVVLLIGIGALLWKNTVGAFFGRLSSFLSRQAREHAETPRSFSSMTSLYLPQIMQDFPQFNWPQFRQRAENLLKSAFLALDSDDPSLLTNASPELKKQVALQLETARAAGQALHYKQVDLHKTAIARYERKKGAYTITLQSAVGYLFYKEQNGKVISGSKSERVQTKYNLELLYIQDEIRFGPDEKILGTVCPHCGAPVTLLGQEKCAYCGVGLLELNINVWCFHRFYEVT